MQPGVKFTNITCATVLTRSVLNKMNLPRLTNSKLHYVRAVQMRFAHLVCFQCALVLVERALGFKFSAGVPP